MLLQHWLRFWMLARSPSQYRQGSRSYCRAALRLMAALHEDAPLARVLHSIQRSMRSGCRLNTRKTHPSTSQLLLDGLDWSIGELVLAHG